MTPRSDKANPVIVHPQFCPTESSAGRQAALAPLQCCLVLAVSWASGATPANPGYDSAFVGMTVPDRVRAAEVFPVAITLRNTGTNACFNPRKRLLYVCTSWAYPAGLESYPIVHAFHLRLPDLE